MTMGMRVLGGSTEAVRVGAMDRVWLARVSGWLLTVLAIFLLIYIFSSLIWSREGGLGLGLPLGAAVFHTLVGLYQVNFAPEIVRLWRSARILPRFLVPSRPDVLGVVRGGRMQLIAGVMWWALVFLQMFVFQF